VRLAGFEPTTPWFVAKYSIQLSYSRQASQYISGFSAQRRGTSVDARCGLEAFGRARRVAILLGEPRQGDP
jgi:hypothetical protein